MTIVLFSSAAATTIPELAEVGALLRARTKERGGTEAGTFTALTRPTGEEVLVLIAMAAHEVLGKVQTPVVGTDYEKRVRGAIALYAAILVESSYFPEQVASGKSPAALYERLYRLRIPSLIAEGETGTVAGMGDTGQGGGDSPADAAWDFPDDAGGLVGWTSRFRYDDEAWRRRCF